jgi:oxygen-dependent protoporphyrinogen oxidase
VAAAPLTIVVGAGISGLTCAYALKKSGQHVLLLEALERPGGVIQSVEENGYLFELGPQSFSSTIELAELCDELGLAKELLVAPHGAPRYVLVENKLTPVPLSPPALLFSGLLSWGTKFSFLRDAFSKSTPPQADESIAAFVRRKFSVELLDRLVGPFVSGIYAGDPEQLSLRAAFPMLHEAEKASGSVIRGGFKSGVKSGQETVNRRRPRPGLLSFRSGNEALMRALATALGSALRSNIAVNEIRHADRKFQVRAQSTSGAEEFECDRLVLATPTAVSARLLQDLAPAASNALDKISYAPVAVVSLGYKREQIGHSLAGFGFLVPRSSGMRTLGSVWNSSLFRARAPENHVLLTNFIGGATDPAAAALREDELAAIVHREIASTLKISGDPAVTRVTRYSRALPQYNLGHLDRLKTTEDAIAPIPGLLVIGNYWHGPAIGACVKHSLAVAEQIRIG